MPPLLSLSVLCRSIPGQVSADCVPIDPYYLNWKARQYHASSRLVEVAAEVNGSMPVRVVDLAQKALNSRTSVPIDNARVLVLGLAYKKNIADVGESASLKLMQPLQQRGATVTYHDPLVKEIPWLQDYPELQGQRSVPLDRTTIETNDVVVPATDHDGIDYPLVAARARLIVDTRNVLARQGVSGEHIIKAQTP
jgi:UDP-N-acetyl-D-glucosamine dehydrogenase